MKKNEFHEPKLRYLKKLFLTMRICLFFLLISVASVNASVGYSQNTKLSLNLKNATIQELIKEIEGQSEFIFVFYDDALDLNQRISIKVEDQSVEKILEKVLASTGNNFAVFDRQIVIGKKEDILELNGADLSQINTEAEQKKQLKGKVTDSKGEPLPGTTVMVKGTTVGTITDGDGVFILDVPLDSKLLLFSFVGYIAQEIPIGINTTYTVTLKEQTVGLEEVVAVGYSVQKKQSVIGAIGAVTNKELATRGGVYNLAQAISGQIGGVVVMENTGEPGKGDPEILIRGKSTWNGSQPLILVDGIERPMSDIDISEVASISVLKDASATAVFGVKGANGVILVTTKRGEVGKPQLTFSASTGFKTLSKVSKMMDSYDGLSWRNEAVIHELPTYESSWAYFTPYEELKRYKKPQVDPYTYLYPNVDWLDALLNDFALNTRYNLNLSGGTEFVKYFASLGYLTEGDLTSAHYNTEKGYDPKFDYKRFNFRGNLDFNLTKSTVFSVNLNGYFGERTVPGSDFSTDNSYGHIFNAYLGLAPNAFPIQYPNGRYGKDPANVNMQNPIAIIQEGGVKHPNRKEIITELKLAQKLDFITKGLSVNANVSYDNYVNSSGPNIYDGSTEGQALYSYIKPEILYAKTLQDTLNATFDFSTSNKAGINDYDFVMQPPTVTAEAVNTNTYQRSLFYQLSANYSRVFGRHDVSGLILFNRRENATGASFPNYREDWVGRVTYNYNNKYFTEFNGAYNGSEKFSTKYRFGFFPSMALGWMVSEENFMKKFAWLSKLKIRGSIGQVGSDAGIPRWGYVDSWKTQGWNAYTHAYSDRNGTFSNSPYTEYMEGTIANPDIRWETALKRNLGVEVSILNRLVTLDIDLFKDKRKDIFMSAGMRNIPDYFGAPAIAANLGETETKGYEMELGVNKTLANGLGLWMKLGITYALDLITKSEDPKFLPDYQKIVGYAIDQPKATIRTDFMNNWDDVFASVPALSPVDMNRRLPGDWDIVDYNADGVINTYDNSAFGYPSRPQKTYTETFGLTYKGLAFMVQFYGTKNISLIPYTLTPGTTRWVQVSEEYSDFWTPQNTDAYYKAPRMATGSNNGDWQIQDASYVRLKTMEISYTLPARLTKFARISNCRIYVNGNNLILWSHFPLDLETGGISGTNAYPMTKQINIGVDVSF